MQNHVSDSFHSSVPEMKINFLYSRLISSLSLSLHLLLLPQSTFHTKSNNVCVQSPPLRHLMCALPGWASTGFLAIYNVNRQPSVCTSRLESRRGEWTESRLNATQVSATHCERFSVFFRIILVSLLPLLASLLSLSSLQTFPLLPLWNWSKISVPRHPGRAH